MRRRTTTRTQKLHRIFVYNQHSRTAKCTSKIRK